MLSISRVLFEKLNNSCLYCHWKSNEHLMPGLDGDTDLDVLVSNKDKEKCRDILKHLYFLNCKSQYGSRYPQVEDWIGFDERTGKLIHLHLHFTMVTGHRGLKEYNLPWSEQALQTRVLDNEVGIYTIEPNLELFTLYSRIVLKSDYQKYYNAKKGHFKLNNAIVREINYLKSRVRWSDFRGIARKYYRENAEMLVQIVQKETLSALDFLSLYKIVNTSMSSYSRYNTSFICIYRLFYEFSIKIRKIIKKGNPNLINRKTPQKKGLIIAFIGQDGAGKSTVTNEILKWLTWKLEARYTYLGVGTNYKSWRKTLQEKITGKRFLKLIRAWLAITKYTDLARYVYNRIISAESYSEKGGIQIFDRYPQTTFPGIGDGPKLRTGLVTQIPKSIRFLFSHYITEEEKMLEKAVSHSPDIVFKLLISPEESVRRKPENNLEMMIKKHDIIKKLNFANSEVVEIDASVPLEKELILIKQIIWNNLIRKNLR